MNPHKALNILLGLLVILGIFAGYWVGNSKAQFVHASMNGLLQSERNLETLQNLKTLEGLREGKIETTIEFMQARVASALRSKGIESATTSKALEYQIHYCKSPCLGLE